MTLLEFFIKEYLSIVETVLDTQPVENDRIILDKEQFRFLLEKYHYMKFQDKTRFYKSLNLILHDKNNYTLPVKDHILHKTVRKVVFSYSAYETLKYLLENQIIYKENEV